MDITSRKDFHPSTLNWAKGKWYVVVTKPTELTTGPSKQIKRSTGTTDKKVAASKQHQITTDIYAGFIKALTPPPETILSVLRNYWIAQRCSEQMIKEYEEQLFIGNSALACEDVWRRSGEDPYVIERLIPLMDLDQAKKLRFGISLERYPYGIDVENGGLLPIPEDPYAPITEPLQAQVAHTSQTPSVNLDAAVDAYHKQHPWNREKTKLKSMRSIRWFIEETGVKNVNDIRKPHAYRFAKALTENGNATSTIKAAISGVTNFLAYCEQSELIELNPLTNLKLSAYGAKAISYRPFHDEELKELFQQKMKPEDRLTLSILLATGMRMDEVALLDASQVKKHKNSFNYLDLTTGALVKNTGSERLVPLHPSIKITPVKTGRLFSYALGKDGKAQGAASKILMKYVRKVSKDPTLTVHSLRGSFKDMLRNSGVTKEINDFITGHSHGDTASSYGSGPSISVRYDAIKDLDLSFMANQ